MKTTTPESPKPSTVRNAWRLFAAVLIATVLLEFLMHPHAEFGVEGTFAFHAWYGFVACAGIVVLSKLLGVLLKRPDTYHDEPKHGDPDPS